MKAGGVLLLAIAALLVACGSDVDGGEITNVEACKEQLSDRLIDESEDGDLSDRFLVNPDSDDLADAIDETTDEFCNEVEVESGVEIEEIDGRARADLVNRVNGSP